MDLGGMVGKAKDLIEQHEDTVDQAVEKAGDLVKDKIGHGDKVDLVVDRIQDATHGQQ